jgi:YidC/Oxa1 family membrane protein insertase
MGLVQWLAPIKPAPKPAPAEQQVADPQKQDQANLDAQKAAGSTVSDPNQPTPPDAANAGQDPAQAVAAVVAKVAEHISLGSMDPKDGFELLVTLSSRGGGIERVEAIDQISPDKFRYKALDTRSAYIGYLALEPKVAGLKIQNVGRGTPAAKAGLVPGDLITQVAGKEVRQLSDLDTILQRTKPGSNLELTIQREGTGESKVSCTTIDAPMDIVRLTNESTEEVAGNSTRLSCLSTLASIDNRVIDANSRLMPGLESTVNGVWDSKKLEREGYEGVEFSMPLASALKTMGIDANLTMVKRYWLPKKKSTESESKNATSTAGYVLDYEVEIINSDTKPHTASLRQEGINGVTLESWWYAPKISPYFFRAAGARDIVYNTLYAGHNLRTCYTIYDFARRNPTAPDELVFGSTEPVDRRSVKYIGVDGYYFSTAFMPHPDAPESLKNLSQAGTTLVGDAAKIGKSQEKAANVSFWLDTQLRTIEPGTATTEKIRIFIGPKQPELLDQLGLSSVIEFGWFWWVAKPLSWLLHFFYAIVGNYGIAIVLLTFLVRSSLFPIGRQAALNAQRMQELAPELKRITEQYKDDYEKRAKATQEFYAKNNFRPWAGCLPLFLQLPIFIGLYRCLSVDIELRQQPLLPGISWCSNLAGPDMLWYWGSIMPNFIAGRGEGWFGPYFNILPCISVCLFIVQQKIMMPKATDEQTQMQQNMMMYMTVFMGLLFFKVPAGLCLYFITSSIWSLIERKLVKRLGPPPKPPVAPAVEPPVRETRREIADRKQTQSSGPKGWLDTMRELADKANAENTTTHRNDKNRDKNPKRKKP